MKNEKDLQNYILKIKENLSLELVLKIKENNIIYLIFNEYLFIMYLLFKY
ncbi:hypothetical protein [Spiroplasma endosymbiont of Colias croceus]